MSTTAQDTCLSVTRLTDTLSRLGDALAQPDLAGLLAAEPLLEDVTRALAAATAVPARRFGLADRGRVAVGLRADLLLVNGDPGRDITAVRDVAVIWKNGYRVDRTA